MLLNHITIFNKKIEAKHLKAVGRWNNASEDRAKVETMAILYKVFHNKLLRFVYEKIQKAFGINSYLGVFEDAPLI